MTLIHSLSTSIGSTKTIAINLIAFAMETTAIAGTSGREFLTIAFANALVYSSPSSVLVPSF